MSTIDSRESLTLGLTLVGHDISYVVLGSDGVPIIISEDERYSRRKKGTFALVPARLAFILREANIQSENVKHLAIANIPELIERRDKEARPKAIPFGAAQLSYALLRTILPLFGELESVMNVRHHLCHASSAFFPSPFQDAAVVTVDGVGEDETATIWTGNGVNLEKLFSIHFPDSVGFLYGAAALWAGLTGEERAGKLMGLASHGQPRFVNFLREQFMSSMPNGGFAVGPSLARRYSSDHSWVEVFEQHFGKRRTPETLLSQLHVDVAASVQALVEEVLLNLLQYARQLTASDYCCLAGGVFMNSMANGKLRRDGPFKEIWVQPMAQDNGLSLGAALFSFSARKPSKPRWRMIHPFLGSEISEEDILSLFERLKIAPQPSECVERRAAELIAGGKLVGWLQGRAEVGARALGHRSIFADPRDPTSKARMNEKIKRREDWRPYAPMVLEEDVGVFFAEQRPSPFMTFVSPVSNGSSIPSVVHIDGTSRVQTVNAGFDSRIYRLLKEFKKLTGVGILLNTSFNRRGEPIVRTVEEAYQIFIESGMDALVLDRYILEKEPSQLWVGSPVDAPPCRITISGQLAETLSTNDQVAIVSLGSTFPHGSSYFIEQVMRAISKANKQGLVTRSLRPPPVRKKGFPFSYNSLVDTNGAEILISELGRDTIVLVLLPIWIELAFELVPNMLAPFMDLAYLHDNVRVFLVDEEGGFAEAIQVENDWEVAGPRGGASQIEYFWSFTRD